MSTEILLLLQEEAVTQFPAFPEAFGVLACSASSALSSVFSTDGLYLYFHPQFLRDLFLTHPEKLRRSYLHVHLHCLCSHIIQTESVSEWLWDLACDLSAELLLEKLLDEDALYTSCLRAITAGNAISDSATIVAGNTSSGSATITAGNASSGSGMIAAGNAVSDSATITAGNASSSSGSASEIAAVSLLKDTGWLDAKKILALFAYYPQLTQIAKGCTRDAHEHWFRTFLPDARTLAGEDSTKSSEPSSASRHTLSEDQLLYLEMLQQKWKKKLPQLYPAIHAGQHSKSGTKLVEDAKLERRDSTDYRKFLRRFAIPREEAVLDMDSFDYIPYHYGLDWCKIPFIEPLEYSEVSRLDELAIAIDTSGSCSGKIVRRFLEETWSILRQKENFFSKMRLHLLQCDLMIQEHRIFTSVEEWEAYLPNLKIHGHGDTDFTPVFTYLEKLIQKREIRHLRGLLYFTDGDGIFPNTAPSFDTAFVFLNQQTEKHTIPAWAIRLNLNLPEEF